MGAFWGRIHSGFGGLDWFLLLSRIERWRWSFEMPSVFAIWAGLSTKEWFYYIFGRLDGGRGSFFEE